MHLRHVYDRLHAWQVGNGGGALAVDVFRRNHVHGRADPRELLLLLRDGSNLDIHQVFQADSGKVARASLNGARDLRGHRQHNSDPQGKG